MSRGSYPKPLNLLECEHNTKNLNYLNEISTVVTTNARAINRNIQIDIKDEFPNTSSKNTAENIHALFLDTEVVTSKPTIKENRPSCWSEKQLKYFQKQNKWLRVTDGKLGCHYCFEVSKLKSRKVVVSPKWSTCKITHYGETLLQQQGSLRKKVFEHRKSIAHRFCHNIVEQKRKTLEPTDYDPSMPNAMCIIPDNPNSPIRIYNNFTTNPSISNDDSFRNVIQNDELIVFPLQEHIKEEPHESYEENTNQNSSDNQYFQDILSVPSEIIVHKLQNQEDDRFSNISCESSEKVTNKHGMTKMLRIMYNIIKQNHPLYSLTNEFTIQTLNGCDFGNFAEGRDICGNVCAHIAREMRKKLIQQICINKSKFSLIIEECTSISEKTVLIIHLRTYFFNDDDPVDIFLDIFTIESIKSRDIITSLLDYLKLWNLDSENQLICISIDGTSSNIGIKSDISVVLHELNRKIIFWNCQNNKLERSVGYYFVNNLKSNSFKNFINKLYNLYSKSLKTQMEFSRSFPDLKKQFLKVGQIINVRCIASSFHTAKAVWNSYNQLHKYVCDASEDSLRDPEDVLLFKELKIQMTSHIFVKNLGILCDALQELNELSIEISSGTLVDAHRSLLRQIKVFESMMHTPGPMSKTANDAIETNEFDDVTLKNTKEYDIAIDRHTFFENIKESLNNRLISKDTMTHFENPVKILTNENSIIENLKIFQAKYWPTDWSATYGENEINSLCQQFQVESRPIIRSFREFKESNGKIVHDKLKSLLKIIHTFPVSTTHCEKVYCQMDSILKVHGNLPVTLISDVLFIQLNGPPLKLFNVDIYLETWLEQDYELQVENRVRMEAEEEQKSIWKLF